MSLFIVTICLKNLRFGRHRRNRSADHNLLFKAVEVFHFKVRVPFIIVILLEIPVHLFCRVFVKYTGTFLRFSRPILADNIQSISLFIANDRLKIPSFEVVYSEFWSLLWFGIDILLLPHLLQLNLRTWRIINSRWRCHRTVLIKFIRFYFHISHVAFIFNFILFHLNSFLAITSQPHLANALLFAITNVSWNQLWLL